MKTKQRKTEHPILFSGPMVRAILDGSKTQTRRIAPITFWNRVETEKGPIYRVGVRSRTGPVRVMIRGPFATYRDVERHFTHELAPFQYDDALWIRETHVLDPPDDGTWSYYDYTDGVIHDVEAIPKRFRKPEFVIYKEGYKYQDHKWRPSIFMPKWASRITLKITKVRLEQIQDISNGDLEAEGFKSYDELIELWNQLNGKRGFPFGSNPWVWAYDFEVVK